MQIPLNFELLIDLLQHFQKPQRESPLQPTLLDLLASVFHQGVDADKISLVVSCIFAYRQHLLQKLRRAHSKPKVGICGALGSVLHLLRLLIQSFLANKQGVLQPFSLFRQQLESLFSLQLSTLLLCGHNHRTLCRQQLLRVPIVHKNQCRQLN